MSGYRRGLTRAKAALLIGAVFLLSFTLWTWWTAVRAGVGLEIAGIALVFHVGAAMVEWPWRAFHARATVAVARIIVVAVALVWFSMQFDTYSWLRHGVDPSFVVKEFGGQPIVSEFVQGMHTLARVADYAIAEALLPLLALVWMAVLPGMRSAYNLLKDARTGSGS